MRLLRQSFRPDGGGRRCRNPSEQGHGPERPRVRGLHLCLEPSERPVSVRVSHFSLSLEAVGMDPVVVWLHGWSVHIVTQSPCSLHQVWRFNGSDMEPEREQQQQLHPAGFETLHSRGRPGCPQQQRCHLIRLECKQSSHHFCTHRPLVNVPQTWRSVLLKYSSTAVSDPFSLHS